MVRSVGKVNSQMRSRSSFGRLGKRVNVAAVAVAISLTLFHVLRAEGDYIAEAKL